MLDIRDIREFPIVDSSKSGRSLILDIKGERVFIATKIYAYLCVHPETEWTIQVLSEHQSPRDSQRFPETKWVAAYIPCR